MISVYATLIYEEKIYDEITLSCSLYDYRMFIYYCQITYYKIAMFAFVKQMRFMVIFNINT